MMDIDAIAARYQGEARLQRLLWIARSSSSQDPNNNNNTSDNAYRLAAHLMRQAGNTYRYREVFGNNNDSTSGTCSSNVVWFDAAWVAQQDMANAQARHVLTSRLAAAQSHLHKDAIRVAYLALSEHDANVGDLQQALHSVLRAKDVCTTRHQTAIVSLQILELSIYTHHFPSVRDYVTKLEHTLGTTSSNSTASATAGSSAGSSTSANATNDSSANAVLEAVTLKVRMASALDALVRGDYDRAAALFRQVALQGSCSSTVSSSSSSSSSSTTSSTDNTTATISSASFWPRVLCGEEVALYASVLALSMSTRSEMVELAQHPEALELAPLMRDCLMHFCRGEYQKCWNILMASELLQDLFLAPHVEKLLDLVRKRAILQYWQAYRCVHVSDMAQALGSGIVPNEQYLIELMVSVIANQVLDDTNNNNNNKTNCNTTRVDLPARLLVRELHTSEHVRLAATQTKLARAATRVLDNAYSMVVRLACLEHDISVRGTSGGTGGGGTGVHRGGINDNNNSGTLYHQLSRRGKRRGGRHGDRRGENRDYNYSRMDHSHASAARPVAVAAVGAGEHLFGHASAAGMMMGGGRMGGGMMGGRDDPFIFGGGGGGGVAMMEDDDDDDIVDDGIIGDDSTDSDDDDFDDTEGVDEVEVIMDDDQNDATMIDVAGASAGNSGDMNPEDLY